MVGELEHVGGMMRLSHFRSNDSFVPEGQERLGLAISRIGGRSGSPIERLVSVSIESHRIVADDRRVGRVWEWPLEVFSSEMDVSLFLSPPSPKLGFEPAVMGEGVSVNEGGDGQEARTRD